MPFEEERYVGLARMVRDLDRCPHGRHQPDVCSIGDCRNGNVGNIWRDGVRIGTNIDGKPITVTDLWNELKRAENTDVR